METNIDKIIKSLKRSAARLVDKFYFPLLLPLAKKSFRKKRGASADLEATWSLSTNFRYGLKRQSLNFNIIPFQKKTEIFNLMKLVANRRPKVILEIGTAGGGTLFYWTQVAPEDSTIISLDLPFGKFGAGYLPTKAKFLKSLARNQQKIELIAGDSHLINVQKKLDDLLAGRPIDFLFIDGDHTYLGVKDDFNHYRKYLANNGVIALHDIVYHRFDPEAEVYKLWQEIKDNYRTEEFIEDKNQDGYGIGVIYL